MYELFTELQDLYTSCIGKRSVTTKDFQSKHFTPNENLPEWLNKHGWFVDIYEFWDDDELRFIHIENIELISIRKAIRLTDDDWRSLIKCFHLN